MRVVLTGGAGFIGSHVLEALLKAGHHVFVIDNLSTGSTDNLHKALMGAGKDAIPRYAFAEDAVEDFNNYPPGVDAVIHLAARGSIPRSIEQPTMTHVSNVDGFFTVIHRARIAGIKRFVYASSSSVYGNSIVMPRQEASLGRQLSPYSATKRINEIYADAFSSVWGMGCVGLRYFNVYGPRQKPDGPYAAVIPKWMQSMLDGMPIEINGDGSQTRDFTYVKDVVRATLLALEAPPENILVAPQINVGTGKSESLIGLYHAMSKLLGYAFQPSYAPARLERKHSTADITVARWSLMYEPEFCLRDGLAETLKQWDLG